MPDWVSGIIAVVGALSARKAAKEQKRADRKRDISISWLIWSIPYSTTFRIEVLPCQLPSLRKN
jgi:hypothetical protein